MMEVHTTVIMLRSMKKGMKMDMKKGIQKVETVLKMMKIMNKKPDDATNLYFG